MKDSTNDFIVWNQVKKILCLRLDTIGDVLMMTPAIRALKASLSGRTVTLLTSSAGVAAAELIPEIDNVLVYGAPWLRATPPLPDSAHFYDILRRLSREKFDGAIIFAPHSQNPLPAAFLCYAADIPMRLAYCHENPYQMLTHWILDPEPHNFVRHEVQRQLDLVKSIGCECADKTLSLSVPQEAFASLFEIIDRYGIEKQKPWLLLHPSVTTGSRRYSPEHFARVIRWFFEKTRFQVILTGSEEEAGFVHYIQSRAEVPSVSLAGKLTLAQLAGLITLSSLLITNNTGPAHIAAAVHTPSVVLYALTNSQHTPWLGNNVVLSRGVLCKYCYKNVCPQGHQACLESIRPEEVVEAALSLLVQKTYLKRCENIYEKHMLM